MMHELKTKFKAAASEAEYASMYLKRVAQLMEALDTATIEEVIQRVEQVGEEGGTIYICANGGSASVASHFVNDANVLATGEGTTPIRAISLTDNVETVTALANDHGYETIFVRQLRGLLRQGDLLIALSVSGNSSNIIRAAEYARGAGVDTIGWCGFDGGALAGLCDMCVHIPTTLDEYGPVEDLFSMLEHIIMTFLAMSRGKSLHHG